MYRRLTLAGVLVLIVVTIAGCTMAPRYTRPDAPIPNTYPGEAGSLETVLPGWRDFFRDPVMQELVSLALVNNRDLRIAMLNIERTRAQFRIQGADLLPTIAASGAMEAAHMPSDFMNTRVQAITRSYSASLGFSGFELDIFGRVRSLTEQALHTYYSAQEEGQAARLTLMSETAGVYLQLVADRESVDLAAQTMENRERSHELIVIRHEAGIASEMEVVQSATLVDEARYALASARVRVEQDENALALLLGAPMPPDLPEVRNLDEVLMFAELPAGLPSELLERRPDIRAAEEALIAANANIGAARANFFPAITLTGAYGTMSTEYSDLFDGGSGFWSFMPQISLPIFDTGRNIARLGMSEADRDMAVARYEGTIQSAFREVADALSQRRHLSDQARAQESLSVHAARGRMLAEERYRAGVGGYIDVLDAERTQFGARNNLIAVNLLRQANALAVYKAMGGGW